MRLLKVLSALLVGTVLVAVVVLIVVEVADYDGRTPAEIARDQRREDPTPLTHCPRNAVGISGEHDPGTAGEAVPARPASALLCEWSYRSAGAEKSKFGLSEAVLRSRADLAKLTDALNSLPPATPLPEGEYACPSSETVDFLIGLRYARSSEVHVAIGPGICGGYSALNLGDDEEYVATPALFRLLEGFT